MISACAPRALSEASASFFGASRQDCALMPAFELALPSERQEEQKRDESPNGKHRKVLRRVSIAKEDAVADTVRCCPDRVIRPEVSEDS